MAFSVNARVRVTNQSSQWRLRYGTVRSVSGNDHQVRLDGFHKTGQTVQLHTNDLGSTGLASPIDYTN